MVIHQTENNRFHIFRLTAREPRGWIYIESAHNLGFAKESIDYVEAFYGRHKLTVRHCVMEQQGTGLVPVFATCDLLRHKRSRFEDMRPVCGVPIGSGVPLYDPSKDGI